VNEHYKEANV